MGETSLQKALKRAEKLDNLDRYIRMKIYSKTTFTKRGDRYVLLQIPSGKRAVAEGTDLQ